MADEPSRAVPQDESEGDVLSPPPLDVSPVAEEHPSPQEPDALESIFDADAISGDHLLTVYGRLTGLVEALREKLRVDAADDAYQRCLEALDRLPEG